jgi:large subunit ribosomal protein L20
MSRKSNNVARKKRVKKVLKQAKGARGRRSTNYRRAKETVQKGLAYAYRDRRNKKREFRSLWITRINAAVRERGLTYGEFTDYLKKNNIQLSRDMLSRLAIEEPKVIDRLVADFKKS